jgi:hypothetical protein
MVLQGVSFGLASVALLVITLVIMWYIRRENNKDYDQMQLNAPLLVSEVLNREEAAAKCVMHVLQTLSRLLVGVLTIVCVCPGLI